MDLIENDHCPTRLSECSSAKQLLRADMNYKKHYSNRLLLNLATAFPRRIEILVSRPSEVYILPEQKHSNTTAAIAFFLP